MSLFHFSQNNSGGKFNDPAKNIIVEADNLESAIQKLPIDLCSDDGTYAAYDTCGCCPCCGHRWTKPWDEKGSSPKSLIEQIKSDAMWEERVNNTLLIKESGESILSNTIENKSAIISYIESRKEVLV